MKNNFKLLIEIAGSCGKIYNEEISKAIKNGEKFTVEDVVLFLGIFTDGILGGFAKDTKVDYKNLCIDYINFLQKILEQIGERKSINQEIK